MNNKHNRRCGWLQGSFEFFSSQLSISQKFPPAHIDTGGIYLVKDANSWHRIRVDDIDGINDEFECFFIDRGQRKIMRKNQLFFCPSAFLTLPPQAVCFSIAGLEEYSDHPYASASLDKYFSDHANKQIVVRSFNAQCQMENIPAEFFEIVDGKSIDCADAILIAITESTPKPAFKENVPTTPRVSHVSDNGIVYFQLDHRSLQYVNESTQLLYDCMQLLTNYDFSSADAVLVYDDVEKRLFRAKITDVLPSNKNYFTCLYIDYGYIRSVPSSRIYNLKMTSVALYNYPNQAVPARLKELTEFDDFTIDRLRGILCGRAKIVAKPIDCHRSIATVEVFKREYPSGHMVSINDWIRMEAELRK